MKRKPSDISTVIIVNKNAEPKTLQLKTKHISRFKHYAAGVLSVIVILTGTVFYLRAQNSRQEVEKKQLLQQISKLKGSRPDTASVDGKKPANAQSYIQSIEGKLQKINEYLKKRGLKGFSNKSVGGNGNADAAKLTDNEAYSLYNEYLDRLVHTVAFTPMGYPHISALTSYFGYRSDPFDSSSAEFHPGIDFKGTRGDPAKCTANGKGCFCRMERRLWQLCAHTACKQLRNLIWAPVAHQREGWAGCYRWRKNWRSGLHRSFYRHPFTLRSTQKWQSC